MSPGNQFIISKWAPPDEKGKFISTLIGGATLGVMLTWPISGYVTETIGWRTAFYGSAVMTLLMTVAWLLFVTDSPAEHRMISSKERAYIESCLGNTVSSQKVMRWHRSNHTMAWIHDISQCFSGKTGSANQKNTLFSAILVFSLFTVRPQVGIILHVE